MPVEKEVNGKRMYRYKQQLFGARGGLIMIFDERDGSRTTATCDEFQARAEALGLEAAHCVYADERKALEDAANCMEACAAEAAAQGDPTDPAVQEYHRRHRSKCGSSILVGDGTAKLGPGIGGAHAKLTPPPKSVLKGGVLLPGLGGKK